MTDIDTAALRELLARATPGPWQWRQSSSGRIDLAAPHGGGTVVMDFARKGMQQAEPRFAVCDDGQPHGRRGGILVGASELIDGDQDRMLRHPDAELIAAAVNALPALLVERDALRAELAEAQRDGERYRKLRDSQSPARVVFDENPSWRPSGGTLDAAIDAIAAREAGNEPR